MKSIKEIVEALAEEEGITGDELIMRLVTEEDRRRHIIQEPFGGDKRVRCYRGNCKEDQKRLDPHEIIEV